MALYIICGIRHPWRILPFLVVNHPQRPIPNGHFGGPATKERELQRGAHRLLCVELVDLLRLRTLRRNAPWGLLQ